MKIKFLRTHPDAKIPSAAHEGDFCYDCYAVTESEIAPNVWKYSLGFALQAQPQEGELKIENARIAFTLRPRSSVWKTGMVLSNCLGTIDKGYIGEISAVFYHVMPNMDRYHVGDKICQIHLDVAPGCEFTEVEYLESTERGANGYGSTGK